MHAPFPLPRRRLTGWSNAGIWLSAFFSPTLYFLLLLLAERFRIPIPPAIFVVSLFCLIPVVALLICGFVVWRSSMTVAWKIGGMLFTLLGMLLQVGVLLVIIRVILMARIAYAQ
jgi:hypothetical protein